MTHLKKIINLDIPSWVIIVGVFITSLARSMIIPFFAVYLVYNMHFSIAAAGAAISARIVGQRGFILVGGPIVDWLGSKLAIGMGLLLMSASYLFTAYSHSIIAIVIWTLILGLGGALYTPAIKSALVNEASYEEKVFILSLRSIALNVGSALGPVIGTVIFIMSPKMMFIFTAIIIFMLAVISQVVLNISSRSDEKKIEIRLPEIASMFKTSTTLKLMAFMMVFYIFYIQLEITYPVFVAEIFKHSTVSYLFLLNALIVIVFQMPLSTWIAKTSMRNVFLIGMSAIALGLMVTSLSHFSVIILFIAITIFSFGEILIMPKLDSETASSISPSIIGTAFGIIGAAGAVGATIGSVMGGRIFHLFSMHLSASYFWMIIGMLVFLILFFVEMARYYYSKMTRFSKNLELKS